MKRIAIIEDNPDNRMLAHAILSDDYLIDEYETGMAGLAGIEQSAPDLVLLDISLPEMDGPEVLQKLRSHPRHNRLPVIALTAHAMAGDRERFLAMGFDDYITKPIVDPDLLIEAIELLLKLNDHA